MSGVYEIKHVPTGRRYIGSAVHFGKRKKLHLIQLRAGNHHNRHLQNAWSKYGAEEFSFQLLVQCTKDMVLFYEQLLMDGLKPEFNLAPVAGSALGVKHTQEFKDNLSEYARKRRAKYAWKGKKRSLVEIAEDLGWHPKVLHNRVLTQKKSLEEAVSLGPETREMGATYEYNGRSLTREEWAKELGINPRRMYYWIAQGLSIAECVARLEKTDKRMSFSELCRQFGISDKTVRSRRENGESLHEALTRPTVKRDNSWRRAKWPSSANGKTN